MNLRDEATERSFMQQLVDKGVPLSSRDLMVGIPFDFDESLQRKQDEAVKMAVSEAKTQAIIQQTLQAEGMVMKTDPMTGEASFVTKEQASLEQAASEEQAAQAKADMAAQAEMGGGKGAPSPSAGGDKPKDESATGGGGRPNVSDEKKKDAPKPKKAAAKTTISSTEDGKKVQVEPFVEPPVRVKRSMLVREFDPSIDGAGESDV
jgi:hypothetical protein